ncbi:hypothetical protein HPP92_023979 [Vanilla planifolia]|uniref:Uncharacterized protein n=1 Tax=Vanilla planifolia TaxID=51239 RepID=A0A835UAQ3_VANPL|nr:hypothetical protein HPP92_023979 [Vanilla planifolia]
MPSFPRATFYAHRRLSSVSSSCGWGKLPTDLLGHKYRGEARHDPASIASAPSDYGKIIRAAPAAVLYPTTARRHRGPAPSLPPPAALRRCGRGCGHSTQGRRSPGKVVEMAALGDHSGRVAVSVEEGSWTPAGSRCGSTCSTRVSVMGWRRARDDYLYT